MDTYFGIVQLDLRIRHYLPARASDLDRLHFLVQREALVVTFLSDAGTMKAAQNHCSARDLD